jgi:hypothetical protein
MIGISAKTIGFIGEIKINYGRYVAVGLKHAVFLLIRR